ncbi:MAG: POTRA domain-containing protein [Planctomycetota bacterium]|jgi:outer membrane protein insertion porin family
MRMVKGFLVVSLVLALFPPPQVHAQAGTVEGLEVQGLFRMSREAFLHAFGLNVGDAYDPADVRRRFKSLWRLGLFENVKIDAEPGPSGGVVLVIRVKELPVLTAVTYEENKAVTRTDIEDALKEQKLQLKLGKPLDRGAVFQAQSAIGDLLAAKGFLDNTVKAEVRTVTETSRAVHFSILPGGKTRIQGIEFVGNELFSDRKLRAQLENTQKRKWYWPWSAKNLYHPAKWDQDVAGVRALYQNSGYLDVEIRSPVIEVRKKKGEGKGEGKGEAEDEAEDEAKDQGNGEGEEPEAESGDVAAEPEPEPEPEEAPPPEPVEPLTPEQQKKQAKQQEKAAKKARKQAQKESKVKRWVYLTVPITEGEPYTLGDVSFSGNKVFTEEILRAMIPLAPGDVLRNNLLDLGVDRMNRLYEDRGYLYASVVRRASWSLTSRSTSTRTSRTTSAASTSAVTGRRATRCCAARCCSARAICSVAACSTSRWPRSVS